MTLAAMEHRVARGADRTALDGIARADTALAIWWRGVPEALESRLATLDLDTVDDVRVEVDAGAPLDGALRDAGYGDAVATPLGMDIAALVLCHAALTGEDRLRVRLEVIETDACRRFHADYVSLRLLCSYVGPGTQWCRADTPDMICEMPTGAVGVFKGRLLLDPPTILHRSPPIAATGRRRLVLVIDPASRAAMS